MPDFTLPKTYDFKAAEQRLYRWWQERGWFQPSNDPRQPKFDPGRPPFVIVIPPPNVTGELHLGHAMVVAVEDLMIRHHRMRGEPTLWLPGTDHAGIATQLQVEKDLLRTEEVTREQLGREAFLERTWAWKQRYGDIINDQLRRLGASCDWTRERFTLDEGLSRAVREAFVRLYEKGLIYRGPRLINWSPGLKTAVSDLEVEYSEEPGTLYTFKYRLVDSDDFIPVATTRPETILGDTAVAVHPHDERYRHLVGRWVRVPMLDRSVPVIADEAVDREFGTGALKITPGHDPVDYEVGRRHSLPIISILDQEARITAEGGSYAGLDRFECRQRLWSDMQQAGLTLKTEAHVLNIPRSQRGGEIVEPMVSTQWFVRVTPLAQAAMAAVQDGRLRIIPERFEKVYFNWLENIRDWCISRQLWWGHRIPVWYCPDGHMTTGRENPTRCGTCGHENLQQDEDVLDTWFSSGLWPFSTLGWPDNTPDYAYFYPTSLLETGYDILFFWVARMIMFGLEFTGQVPFHTVYLHGLVRDGEGRKMSKTLGNVIDPRQVMDTYGTDALRFTLLTGSTPGDDTNLSLQRVEANRNFANKVWNAGRFVIGALDRLQAGASETPAKPTLADAWIEARLRQTVAEVNRQFNAYQYGQAGRQVVDFFWSEFADWYIEVAKFQLAEGGARASHTAQILVRVLDRCLRLLHPYTPYVTEELWQHLRSACQNLGPAFAPDSGVWPEALIVAPWPEAEAPATGDASTLADFKVAIDDGGSRTVQGSTLADFVLVINIVRAIRNARAENAVPPAKRVPATIVAGDAAHRLEPQREILAALARLEPMQFRIIERLPEKIQNAVALVVGRVEVYLPLAGMVDVESEQRRLADELAKLQAQIDKLQALLAGEFAHKAPAAIVDKERARLESLQESKAKLQRQITGRHSGHPLEPLV